MIVSKKFNHKFIHENRRIEKNSNNHNHYVEMNIWTNWNNNELNIDKKENQFDNKKKDKTIQSITTESIFVFVLFSKLSSVMKNGQRLNHHHLNICKILSYNTCCQNILNFKRFAPIDLNRIDHTSSYLQWIKYTHTHRRLILQIITICICFA